MSVTSGLTVLSSEGTKIPQAFGGDPKHSPSPFAADKSDDDDSDHGDPYGQHMKGRVSPSPYTANTERARQFNAYVRNLIEEKLDILIPISHQPRELVQQIISDSNLKFPEFSTSVRKRIRTYLKSYRRSRRVKDMQAAAALASNYHTNGLPVSHKDHRQQPNEDSINVSAIALPPSAIQANSSAIVTISGPPRINNSDEDGGPELKKMRMMSNSGSNAVPVAPQPSSGLTMNVNNSPVILPVTTTQQITPVAQPQIPSSQGLTNTDVATLKQLIQGYRESANFLHRAADQLEDLLSKDNDY